MTWTPRLKSLSAFLGWLFAAIGSSLPSSSVLIAKVLGKMGTAARDALPELRDAAQDPYVELQTAAKKAIEQVTEK